MMIVSNRSKRMIGVSLPDNIIYLYYHGPWAISYRLYDTGITVCICIRILVVTFLVESPVNLSCVLSTNLSRLNNNQTSLYLHVPRGAIAIYSARSDAKRLLDMPFYIYARNCLDIVNRVVVINNPGFNDISAKNIKNKNIQNIQ